jgi:hypothetical protein
MQITGAAWQQSVNYHNESYSFPFVTLSMFELAGTVVRENTGLELIVYGPILPTINDVTVWESYSNETQWWVNESWDIDIAREDSSPVPSSFGNDWIFSEIKPLVYNPNQSEWNTFDLYQCIELPCVPLWQMSPPPFTKNALNMNVARMDGGSTILVAIESQSMVISSILDLSSWGNLVFTTDAHDSLHTTSYVIDASPLSDSTARRSFWNQPHSVIAVPVYDGVNPEIATVAGIVAAVLPWDRYLTNLLPSTMTAPISTVLRNSCNQSYSYRLVGNMVRICLVFEISR